jgi:hypothetical protein
MLKEMRAALWSVVTASPLSGCLRATNHGDRIWLTTNEGKTTNWYGLILMTAKTLRHKEVW